MTLVFAVVIGCGAAAFALMNGTPNGSAGSFSSTSFYGGGDDDHDDDDDDD